MINLTRTPVEVSALGTTTIIAAQGVGTQIRVHQCHLMASGDVIVQFLDGAGNDLSGPIDLTDAQGFVMNFSEAGWLVDAADNQAVRLTLDGNVQVGGVIGWRTV